MPLPEFDVEHPDTLAEALEILATNDEAAFYMGGTELLLAMKLGLAAPQVLVDGKRLRELRRIAVEQETLHIGAGETHRDLETSEVVCEAIPVFAELERQIANPRVRNAGTIGGNLCFGEPRSDPATLLVALGAEIELVSAQGLRSLHIEDFLLGPFQTALNGDELMTGLKIPLPKTGTKLAYRRLTITERPIANVAVLMNDSEARVVVGALGPSPQRLRMTELALQSGVANTKELAGLVRDEANAAADTEGSPEYKRHVASVLVSRALTEVLA